MSDDPINPGHYKTEVGIEAIDVIEAFELDFLRGNAVKYILRAGRKDPAKYKEDLAKAKWYIDRAIHGALSHVTEHPVFEVKDPELESGWYYHWQGKTCGPYPTEENARSSFERAKGTT
jgi:hypothetical protein